MKRNIIAVVIIVVVAACGIGAFIWSYSQMVYYRDNSEEIAYLAAEVAKKEQYKVDEETFNEKMKQPYAEFVGPADFGSISFNYPRTWSAYNIQNDSKGYEVVFYPGVIPPMDDNMSIALKVQVINNEYEDELSYHEDATKEGALSAAPITISDNQEGIIFNGNLEDDFTSSFVLLKLRDKTLLIQTDTDKFLSDFNDIILKTFNFVP